MTLNKDLLRIKYKGVSIYLLSGNGDVLGCDDNKITDRDEKFSKIVRSFESYLSEKGFKLEDIKCKGFYS